MAKSVTISLLVLCGILCTAYSAPASSQEYAKMNDIVNLLDQMAKQQSSRRTMAEQVMTQAMKKAVVQFIGYCPPPLLCSNA